MAAEVHFIYSGGGREVIPRDATHVAIHPSVAVIPARLFSDHLNIVELICHDGVIKIEECAFWFCPRLKRVILRGVKVVGAGAFFGCGALTDVECRKLERIERAAFECCDSLSSINLTSVRIVERVVFRDCPALKEAIFGNDLEMAFASVFANCPSLERITIPLKDGLITHDNIFQGCRDLKCVDLAEGAVLRRTIAALLLEEWRNDMIGEIESINRILPHAPAGNIRNNDAGEKARAIRAWITSVLDKIIAYKAQHRRLVNEAASTLTHVLPDDTVMNNILPFLTLPSHTFEGEDVEN